MDYRNFLKATIARIGREDNRKNKKGPTTRDKQPVLSLDLKKPHYPFEGWVGSPFALLGS